VLIYAHALDDGTLDPDGHPDPQPKQGHYPPDMQGQTVSAEDIRQMQRLKGAECWSSGEGNLPSTGLNLPDGRRLTSFRRARHASKQPLAMTLPAWVPNPIR